MKNLFLCFVGAAALFSLSAHAEDQLAIYGGGFDVSQTDDSATLLGAEYRFEPFYHGLRPVVGGFVTTDSGAYGYGGLQWDIFLTDNLVLAPHTAAGLYHQGAGKDLHDVIEFKSGIELGYECEDGNRFFVDFSHLSNAGIGDDNPGTETLVVGYSFPW